MSRRKQGRLKKLTPEQRRAKRVRDERRGRPDWAYDHESKDWVPVLARKR